MASSTSPSERRRVLTKLSKSASDDLDSFLSRLRREKNFLERVFNALSEGVVVATPALRVLAMNERARELLGLPEGRRTVGHHLMELVDNPDLRSFLLRLDPASPEIIEREIQTGLAPDRGPRILHARVSPLPGEEDSLGGVVLTLADTTERHRLEAQRRHAEKLASLATLTAGVAHDLKNPLNSMSIHAQLLLKRLEAVEREGEDAVAIEDIRGSLEIVWEEMQRLGEIVNEFLQAARPTAPWMEPRPLNNALRRVAELARPDCERRGISLRVALDPDLKLVQFDDRQFSQAILNLLKNAAEAIEERVAREVTEGAQEDVILERMEIVLRSQLRGERAVVSVSDTGIGIPEEDFQRIFEPYFTTKFAGTGLGLMNVYRIVQEHEGKLEVESSVGEGTTFTISIPLRAPLPVRALEGGGAPPALEASPSGEKKAPNGD
jgi:two-component system, sporulation sensor kinase E